MVCMDNVIRFPIIKKSKVENVENRESERGNESEVLEFKKPVKNTGEGSVAKACLFEGAPNVRIGGEIVVEIYGKKYKGVVTNIIKDGRNISKVAYNIPFLNSDDPLKFGEANCTYDVEIYD